MNDDVVQARSIDGVLYIEASVYQELVTEHDILKGAYNEVKSQLAFLQAENHALRTPDEG